MFDPMDHIAEWESVPARGMPARQLDRYALIRFAKYFLVEYLNSGKSVDECVDEWCASSAGGVPPSVQREGG